ncbi:lysine-specific demethylase JMJ706-like [Carica papaya]|uniref:lysine-specific demethylase JMJ706-like n=1 Tax=Carica papaya TaxID=3649 RepID=UPI000B8C80C4|nr:lysine-specific demethylase JMJ706-like [Carica papaya]
MRRSFACLNPKSHHFPFQSKLFFSTAPPSVTLTLLRQCKTVLQAKLVHQQILTRGLTHHFTTHLVASYLSLHSPHLALSLLQQLPPSPPDVFWWNVLIRDSIRLGFLHQVLRIFSQMRKLAWRPDHYTFPFVLKACGELSSFRRGASLHALVCSGGFDSNVFVCNALVAMYGRCGTLDDARQVFDEMLESRVWDVISWNSVMAAYAQNGDAESTIIMFDRMINEFGSSPDAVGVVNALPACASMGAWMWGKQVHGFAVRSGLFEDKVDNFDMTSDLEWTEKISECPVYRPSVEEFHDPLTFLQKIARQASKYGICKIVSPLKASVSASDVLMKERRGFKFKTYVQRLPLVEGHKIPFSKGENNYTYQSFESMANKAFIQRFPSLRCLSPATLEKKFWHEMAHGRKETVEYGVNIEGSGFSSDPNDQLGNSKWNLKSLSHLPNSTFRLLQYQIPGITDPMLYIGMLFSIFAWHVEDHYLYSINYHHSGAAKIWYGVPGETAFDFEKVVQEHVSASSKKVDGVSESLAEKTTMFPPRILLEHNITVYRTVQMPGEFVITFPKAYHAGFSLGFNCGEAVNLAIGDWFPWGAIARENYALVGKMVIFPFEELICKEAILLFKSWRNESSEAEHFSECPIKVSFLHYICSFNKALRKLNDLGALFSYSSVSQGTIHCSFCKRDCYLGFLECNCCYLHSCLFHGFNSLPFFFVYWSS